MAGRFVLKRSGDQFMFNLLAGGNWEVILTSERYTRKASALEGVSAVRSNAPFDAQYERKQAADGRAYFVLRGRNYEVLGTSETYSSAQSREGGIAAVKENAPLAEFDDRT